MQRWTSIASYYRQVQIAIYIHARKYHVQLYLYNLMPIEYTMTLIALRYTKIVYRYTHIVMCTEYARMLNK